MGNGKGGFTPGAGKATGFSVSGDAKAVARLITAEDTPLVLVSVNGDSLRVFEEPKAADRQVVRLRPDDAFAELYFRDGRRRREEFSYGAGYLSQSSRALVLDSGALREVFITGYRGGRRKVELRQPLIVGKQ